MKVCRPSGRRRNLPWQDAVALLLLLAVAVWLWLRVRDLPAYGWQWPLLGEFLLIKDGSVMHPGLLLRGLATTLRVGLWSYGLALLIGSLLGMAFTRREFWLRFPCFAWVNLVRNTPPLVILFSVYFFAGHLIPVEPLEKAIRNLGSTGQQLVAMFAAPPGQMDRFLAAVLALGAYQGAYVAEIVRSGIASVPNGQWDAARALGLPRLTAIRLVIFPQALRLMLPPLTGQAISTLKDSALASLISLPDLTFQSLEIMAVSDMTFEIWVTTATIYLLIGGVCAILGSLFERYLAKGTPM